MRFFLNRQIVFNLTLGPVNRVLDRFRGRSSCAVPDGAISGVGEASTVAQTPVEEGVHSENNDFNPLQEVRQLRRDLAHRLMQLQEWHVLQEPHVRRSATVLVPSQSPGDALPQNTLPNDTQTPNAPPPIENDISPLSTVSASTEESFGERLQTMKELLARLQIACPEKLGGSTVLRTQWLQDMDSAPLPVADEAVGRTTEENFEAVAEASESRMDASDTVTLSHRRLDFLFLLHIVLTSLGFLGMLGGFVRSLRQELLVSNPSMIFISTGVLVVALGISSQCLAGFCTKRPLSAR